MKNIRRNLLLGLLCILITVAIALPVFAVDEPTYVSLEGAGFAGRCNLRFYQDNAGRAASNESVRYMVVWVLNQDTDEESLIMSGNWSANTTAPNGALVMGWRSLYGPYPDATTYAAKNCSACNVTPDYLWVAWGLLGDYTIRGLFGRPTSPWLTLDGIGVGVDWDEEEVLSLGEISLRGQVALRVVNNVTTVVNYKPQVMIQALQVDGDAVDAPHWNSWGSAKLIWEEDGTDCWYNLSGNCTFICDWLYEHFGLDICPEIPSR